MNEWSDMMKVEPLVSVIIPVYNVEKYLIECLDSVIKQTYKNLQIIVVDDGSTDSSGKMCDKYAIMDARIQVIHKKNGGQSSARNQGMKYVKGKYVYFLDSDDYITLDAIEKMVKEMETSDAEALTFLCKPFGSSKDLSKRYYRTLENRTYTGHEFFSYCQSHEEFYPVVWLYFYKYNLIKNKCFIEGIVFEDTPYTFELLASDVKVKFVPEVLNCHRMIDGSTMRSAMSNYKLKCSIVVINIMLYIYERDTNRTIEQKRFISWRIGIYYMFLRQLKKADKETILYNREISKLLKNDYSLITKDVITNFLKTIIKKPFNICPCFKEK